MLPYFEKWVQRWKNFDELAAASEADVLRAWEGLGYYSRAKNLLAAARKISAEKSVPDAPDGWRAFRGIGAYTAAAIASIAQGIPVAVVDGNIVRILARLSGDETVFRDSATAAAAFSVLAENLLDRKNPGDHNEAMMELGALVCSRNSPRCTICPVEKFCRARAHGNAKLLPKFAPKKTKKKEVERLVCRRANDGAILLVRNEAETRRLKNLCEFPNAADFSVPEKEKSRWEKIFEGKRGIADEMITERFLRVPDAFAERLAAAFRGVSAHAFFASPNELGELVFSGPHRKWLPDLLKNAREKSSAKGRKRERS